MNILFVHQYSFTYNIMLFYYVFIMITYFSMYIVSYIILKIFRYYYYNLIILVLRTLL